MRAGHLVRGGGRRGESTRDVKDPGARKARLVTNDPREHVQIECHPDSRTGIDRGVSAYASLTRSARSVSSLSARNPLLTAYTTRQQSACSTVGVLVRAKRQTRPHRGDTFGAA